MICYINKYLTPYSFKITENIYHPLLTIQKKKYNHITQKKINLN